MTAVSTKVPEVFAASPLSGIIGLALDADLPRSLIADELRRAAEILCPSHGVRFSMVDERMSIDPALDEPPMPIDPAIAR